MERKIGSVVELFLPLITFDFSLILLKTNYWNIFRLAIHNAYDFSVRSISWLAVYIAIL